MGAGFNDIPEFDDIADKNSYKLYKWMASKKSFTLSDLKKKFSIKDNNNWATILSGIAMMGYLGIKKASTDYYSNDELANISPMAISNATIIPTPLLLRYVQKRRNENLRWFASIFLSTISLIVSIVALVTSSSSKAIDVNITSWPATAETAQVLETAHQ